ncbi:hypothetical protein JCM15548_1976 [Geofilum rubicundum JCM 15548]|uniref:GH10 domain-containing protein n=1 Tax=Geofilum rubicundum JCM 15548 TaxID=1236989 RepID=A0A0E9LUL8_9BACT|nr:hypothetical protein JCM15548_1976 [Geofilum rubicundum JCM 15548]
MFYVDGNIVHETSTHSFGTYSFLWENLEAGSYRITARAINDQSVDFVSAGVLVTVGTDAVVKRGLSAGKGKYLGNIIGYSGVRSDFLQYWNGVTAENGSKWGVVEGTRDVMNWTNSDVAYYLAEINHLSYRYHAIAWGSQYPSWIEGLSSDVTAFRAEMEEYMAAIAERYTHIDQIDVLNENLYLNTYNGKEHAAGTPFFREGLGGPGETGYDWAIWLFQKAREYFPNSRLVMNDFELENNPDGIHEMLDVVKVLRDRGLIDGFGTQAHTFNVDGMANQTGLLKTRIDLMASGGVPVYVTELDLTGNSNTEASQLYSYQNIFPVFWKHPAVAGITLWGYVEGSTWKTGTGLLNEDGSKRSAMLWLESYMNSQPDLGYPHFGDGVVSESDLILNGEFDINLEGWTIQNNSGAAGTMEVVTGAGLSGSKALKVCPAAHNPGTANWHVQVRYETPIEMGKTYSLSFSAKADAARSLGVAVQRDGGDYATHFGRSENLTVNVQDFSYSYVSAVTDATAKLKFYLGGNATCVYIDNVRFVDQSGATTLKEPLQSNEDATWSVFPNPFDHQIVVDSQVTSRSDVLYHIFNMNGQLASHGRLNEQGVIASNHMKAGVYFLRLESVGAMETIKIVKH